MLCLGRKIGETIWIGETIRVTVKSLSSSRVKLAIEAPKGVHVLRGELLRRLQSDLDENEVSEL